MSEATEKISNSASEDGAAKEVMINGEGIDEKAQDALEEEAAETVTETEEEPAEQEVSFSILNKFSSEVLNLLSSANDPLSEDERKPKPLPGDGRDYKDVIKLLQDLMMYDSDEPEVSYDIECPDGLSKGSITAHMISAALTTVHPLQLRKLATRLLSDTSIWISRLFRKFESATCIHDEAREGVIRVGRMLLHTKYPRYSVDGHSALYARPPLIYVSGSMHSSMPVHVATNLGLGSSSVRVVPCNSVVGSPISMDTAALEKMIANDIAGQKKPLMVIANVGGGVNGGIDNINRIQEICNANDVWLHLEGHNLAALPLNNSSSVPASAGDSMTLPLGMWLGVPALPHVTVYKVLDAGTVHAAGLTSLNLGVRIDALELWMTLLTLGSTGVMNRLRLCFELTEQVQHYLASEPTIRLLSNRPMGDKPPYTTMRDVITAPVSSSHLLDSVCSTVVFQYVPEGMTSGKNSEYYDNLNSWLGQVVRREVLNFIPLELVSFDAGIVLRWCPFEGPFTHQLSPAAVEDLVETLQQQIEILKATVKQRKAFSSLVNANDNLQLAEIPQWAGLGGVRYIPDIWHSQGVLSDSAKQDVNFLNSHLVEQLKTSDSAFSLGEGVDGLMCVRFGMVTEDTDLDELLTLVLNTGKEIENSSKFLEQMTQVVKKGIEKANEDLKRENDEKIWNEGLLRHVPLFGSVYNWLSPPPNQGIRGRSLNLHAGVLESTENIYKYHMQIAHGTAPSHGDTKLPPAPSVQTAVTPTPSTTSHSRNSSHNSFVKQAANPETASDTNIETPANTESAVANGEPVKETIDENALNATNQKPVEESANVELPAPVDIALAGQ